MKKSISVFEYQPIKVGGVEGLTEKQLKSLSAFYDKGGTEKEPFPYYTLINNGVKFSHYVGVLSVGDLTIEVLPKLDNNDKDKNVWRDCLIHMLSKVHKLDVKTPSNAKQKTQHNSPILDVFINKFLKEVDALVNRGLVRYYHKTEDNRKSMKGKLLVGKHVTTNYVHKERFYVSYTTYDYEHVLNRILRQALGIVPKVTSNLLLRGRAKSLLLNFPDVHEIDYGKLREVFAKLKFDRKTEDYREAIKLARLLLMNFSPKLMAGKLDILALMFDMNKLWEEYVTIMLRRALPDCKVSAQQQKDFWKGDSGRKTIRPDIVVSQGDKTVAVLDTKWKCPTDGKPSDADLKQMFVYHCYWTCNKTALLYPADSETKSVKGEFEARIGDKCQCHMIYLPIQGKDNSIGLNLSEVENFVKPKPS